MPTLTSVFLKNDIRTSTIIVVFSAFHDMLSYNVILCVLLRIIDSLYTITSVLSRDKVKINIFRELILLNLRFQAQKLSKSSKITLFYKTYIYALQKSCFVLTPETKIVIIEENTFYDTQMTRQYSFEFITLNFEDEEGGVEYSLRIDTDGEKVTEVSDLMMYMRDQMPVVTEPVETPDEIAAREIKDSNSREQ